MSSRSDIIDGKGASSRRTGLIYTCVCGWIDLGHARPDGALALWNRIRKEIGKPSGDRSGFKVTYSQSMSAGPFSASYLKEYWVKRGLPKAKQESVALSIFMEISLGFEALQSGFPFNLTTDSGFSAEDLVSDLLGFYRALRPNLDYISMCEPVDKQTALKVWDTHGAVGGRKNYQFAPLLYPCSVCKGSPASGPAAGQMPWFLKSITPAKKGDLFRNWSMLDEIDTGAIRRNLQLFGY